MIIFACIRNFFSPFSFNELNRETDECVITLSQAEIACNVPTQN